MVGRYGGMGRGHVGRWMGIPSVLRWWMGTPSVLWWWMGTSSVLRWWMVASVRRCNPLWSLERTAANWILMSY
ncbi:unnamed protein product [Toxocara canis]|uniref:Uncharacterized protein n=1 Tax=Toxocara canis TaxID=6265 RepID=A0A183U870_TOXCA|nr:unnamed protein product [Toxocara canis]